MQTKPQRLVLEEARALAWRLSPLVLVWEHTFPVPASAVSFVLVAVREPSCWPPVSSVALVPSLCAPVPLVSLPFVLARPTPPVVLPLVVTGYPFVAVLIAPVLLAYDVPAVLGQSVLDVLVECASVSIPLIHQSSLPRPTSVWRNETHLETTTTMTFETTTTTVLIASKSGTVEAVMMVSLLFLPIEPFSIHSFALEFAGSSPIVPCQ